jgi:hypothetical protein
MQHNGSLFFYSKTINEDKRYQQKYDFTVPPANSKYIRLEYNFFIVEYRPIAKDSAKVRIGMNVDLRMNYLPNWILSISARKVTFSSNIVCFHLLREHYEVSKELPQDGLGTKDSRKSSTISILQGEDRQVLDGKPLTVVDFL